jgi:hypothetical protein
MKINRFFPLIVLLLVIPIVTATDCVDIKTENNDIVFGTNQVAHYFITVENEYDYDEAFEFYVQDYSWNIWSSPLSDYLGGGVTIPEGENYTIELFIKPTGDLKSIGRHNLPFIINAKTTNNKLIEFLAVDITSGSPTIKEYATDVIATVNFPVKIDPLKSYTMDIFIENSFPKEIKNLIVDVKSEIFSKQTTIDLDKLERTNIKFQNIEIDPYQPPIEDKLIIGFYVDDVLIKEIRHNYIISGYSKIEQSKEIIKDSFMKKIFTQTYTNDGNKDIQETVQIKTSQLKRIFTSSNPNYYVIKNPDGRFMSWDLNLGAGESVDITIKYNYWIIVYLLIILGVLSGGYYLVRSPLILDKSIKILSITDGAISDLKVLVHIKNRTNNKITRIRVADRVPGLVAVDKNFEIGTIKPLKITSDNRGGTLIKWELTELEPYEERIITYSIKAKFKVIGDFVLPSVLAKFFIHGSELKTKSGLGRIKP